jgi:hypothetical protein
MAPGGPLVMRLLPLLACLPALLGSNPAWAGREAPFSLAIGTQAFDVKYQFTDDPGLLELAKAIEALGADTLKMSLSDRYTERYQIDPNPEVDSILDLLTKEPVYKEVLDMPFRNILFWIYPFAETFTAFKTGEIPADEAEAVYKEIYEATAYLLKTYSGSGKSFFIGNWEGDWHLTGIFDYELDASEKAIEGAIKWFNLREKAVADARRETPHKDVEVYFYVELNFLKKAMQEDRPAIVNRVLPHIKTDFVSWSSYDISNRAGELGGEAGRKMVHEALDYIEAHLPPSDIPGKRVWIGEYGYKQEWVKDPEIQAKYTAEMMRWSLEWGCPFVLYWQIYCNEFREDLGTHRGFWLINDKGEKLPAWHLHKTFLDKARSWVEAYQEEHGRLPLQDVYNRAAVDWIEPLDKVRAAPLLFEEKGKRKAPFSVSVGTQVIDSKYQFTDEPFLLEAAKEVLEMGGDTLKFDHLTVVPGIPPHGPEE